MRLSGRFRAAGIIGMQGIRARKLRTLLSMVSLFLGVLAVVVVQASSVSAERATLQDIELHEGIDGTHQLYLGTTEKTAPVVLDTLAGQPRAIAVTSMQAIIGEPGVVPINPGGVPLDPEPGGPYGGYAVPVTVVCGPDGCYQTLDQSNPNEVPGQAIELSLSAMTGDLRQFRPFRLLAGRWLDFSGDPSLSPGIVVNLAAAKGFAAHRVPAEMRIHGATANLTPRIIGVVEDGAPNPIAYARTDEILNWVPARSYNAAFGGGLQVLLQPDATDVERVLTSRLVAAGMSPDQLRVQVLDSRKSIERSLTITRWIFFGLASMVLLIGVAGILNVGLATVGERVEEFALRRAVGTPRLLLAGIVLAETLVTGLLTASAAIGAAALGLRAVGSILATREPALASIGFPWQAAVAGIVAGVAAGILGGLVPAIRAARIPIASVMRA